MPVLDLINLVLRQTQHNYNNFFFFLNTKMVSSGTMDYRNALLLKPIPEPQDRTADPKNYLPWDWLSGKDQEMVSKDALDTRCYLLEKFPRGKFRFLSYFKSFQRLIVSFRDPRHDLAPFPQA